MSSNGNLADLIQGMFFPNVAAPIAPSNESIPSNQRPVRINGQIVTGSTATPPGNYARGTLVLDLYKGPAALYIADCPQVSTIVSAPFTNFRGQIVNLALAITPGQVTIPWEAALINLSPFLASTFSVGRLKAMALSIQASTISTTTAALGGLMAASVVPSINGIDVSDFAQITAASMLPESSLSNVPAFSGIYACQGPFLSRDFGPLESILSKRDARDAVVNMSLSSYGTYSTTVAGDDPNVSTIAFQAIPGITMTATGAVTPLNAIVSLSGSGIDHGVYPELQASIGVVNLGTGSCNVAITVVDYYVSLDPTTVSWSSSVNTRTLQTSYLMTVGTNGVTNGGKFRTPKHTVRPYYTVNPSAPPVESPELQLPRYVGSFMTFQLVNLSASPNGVAFSYDVLNITIPGQYDTAMMGPKQLISWNGLNTNQQLTITGVEVVEVVTNNNISQYISGQADKTTTNESDLQTAKALFTIPGGLRVFYTLADAHAFFGTSAKTASHLYSLTRSNPIIGTRLSASGIFQNIGAALGGGAGSMIDNTLGEALTAMSHLNPLSASGMSASGMTASGRMKRPYRTELKSHRVEELEYQKPWGEML